MVSWILRWSSVASAAFATLGYVLALVWVIVLLATAVSDPRRRGLHDKWTGTAIVRPVGQSDASAWVTLVLPIVLVPLLAIVALIYLGSQVSGILSTVGVPAP